MMRDWLAVILGSLWRALPTRPARWLQALEDVVAVAWPMYVGLAIGTYLSVRNGFGWDSIIFGGALGAVVSIFSLSIALEEGWKPSRHTYLTIWFRKWWRGVAEEVSVRRTRRDEDTTGGLTEVE